MIDVIKFVKIFTMNYPNFLVVTLFVLLVGCQPKADIKSIYVAPHCLVSQTQCVMASKFGEISVLFNVDEVTSEQNFSIIIAGKQLTSDIKVEAYLEGKEMYMGKIPLFFTFDPASNTFTSEALIGSCSEEKMIWQMSLKLVKDQAEGQVIWQQFFIDFQSRRSF